MKKLKGLKLQTIFQRSPSHQITLQKFYILNVSTLKGRKSELILEPPSGFKHGTPVLGIQHHGNPAPKNMTEPLIFIKSWQTGTDEKTKKKQKPTLFLTKQCWSPRYKVTVLFVCGGCHPEEFIVASFYNLKHS